MDFNKETNIAIEKVIAEKLPQMIEDKTTKMIEDIVSDIFRWGNVKDSIKSKIEESINVNLQKFDLIDYSSLIGKVINENLVSQVNIQPIIDMTQNIVGFVDKKEISLYEINQMFIEAAMEDQDQDGEGKITFIVDDEDESTYNWVHVYADIEANKEKRQCTFEFTISTRNEGARILSMYINNWRGRKSATPELLSHLYGIEAKIFRLYSAQVKITDLDGSMETYWSRY
ncbi:hypothetical protein DRF62_02315 [Chryseobacterium piscium]|uniref:Uncharacterized protein n=1 Tax=Chryseobacterium piscium TaxID=333702 RepID=A0A3D9BU96_9FLAO|nr:hypothetical protein [Chryseobacterium piscium]REC57012.1 hypothetical protein DRF62_02315 [Chryseobacterium piscium]